MKKIIFWTFLFCLFVSWLAILDARAETYAVERADGGITVVAYQDGANDSLETVLRDLGLLGRPIKKVSNEDFPSDRSDRDFWKLNDIPIGKKIVIDTVKKQAKEAEKAQKELRKQALLKMTPAEYQEAKDLGLVR